MKRENILINEDYTAKRVAATKFTAPGDAPAFDCSIHFGEEENDVTMQNCNIKDSAIVKCSPDDTYDFEVGALIALMKMCGVEKVKKAAKETFFDVAENSVNEYEEEIKTLKEKFDKKVSDLRDQIHENSRLIQMNGELRDKVKELEEENKMLCGKIKFLDNENRNLVYGGRQNGKQYTALVELFKKIPQNKVDEAYKEAYNTKLPVWQREFLKEALSIYKPPTKREQMWNDILSCGDCEHSKYVEVKKEDLEAFAKECNEKKIFNIIGYEFNPQSYWSDDDSYIFQIFRKPAGFICTKRVGFVFKDTVIDYLPPMRWDLFKKGRLVVGCTEEEVPEFIEKAKRELGNIRIEKYSIENIHCNGPIKVYYHYDKDTNWLKPLLVSGIPRVKVNNHKVYYWEDVR